MNDSLLVCQGISKVYQDGDRKIQVLDTLDLNLSSHELLAVTGTSGSGKSTLLHILGTLDTPTAGTVLFKNQDVVIKDKVTAVVIGAQRVQSEGDTYETTNSEGKTVVRVQPDSIIITLSEDLIPLTHSGTPWDSLVLFSETCDKENGHFLL